MNKYAALTAAVLAILSSAVVAGADHNGETIASFDAGDDTYYVHESGLYKETNQVDGLQLDPGRTTNDQGEHVDYGPDKRAEAALAP